MWRCGGAGDRAGGPAHELKAWARAPDSARELLQQVHAAGVWSDLRGKPGTTRELRKAPVRMIRVAATLIATLIAAAAASAAPGSLDSTFGAGGKTTTSFGTGSADIYALVLQPDGKMVAAGWDGSQSAFALVRHNANGSLDTTFGTGGTVITSIGTDGTGASALVLQPDGKLVAAGTTTNDGSAYDFTLVRYNANGSLDATFGTGGKVTTPIGTGDNSVSALVLQSDGKLVAAGYALIAGTDDFTLVRYLGQVCGDAIVAAPEQCDAGAANGTASSCCTGSCQFATAGTTCTGGHCDGTGDCLPAPTTTITTTSTTTTTAPPTTTSTTTSTATSTTATSTTTTTTTTPTTKSTTSTNHHTTTTPAS